jgi:hypothetical protein
MTIEPKISKYLDEAIERERVIFSLENGRRMDALKEFFQDEVKGVAQPPF